MTKPNDDKDTVNLPTVIAETFGGSRAEARRMLAQGAIRLDGESLDSSDQEIAAARLDNAVLQAGRRRSQRL
jgi:tyrosyl-tRNA synthetase